MNEEFVDENGKQKRRQKCQIYTRVMGYLRPISHFNIGKKSEFYSRTYFTKLDNFNEKFNKHYARRSEL